LTRNREKIHLTAENAEAIGADIGWMTVVSSTFLGWHLRPTQVFMLKFQYPIELPIPGDHLTASMATVEVPFVLIFDKLLASLWP
jgi:hypothetical protein